MPTKIQSPLGHGEILWLGINQARGEFSTACDSVLIHCDGIEHDMYRGMWRQITGHDGDYIANDGVKKYGSALNLRQITLVDEAEVTLASSLAGVTYIPGMLRENIAVRFRPMTTGQKFSGLPPLSRMVIHGRIDPKVLILTEENGPCKSICNPAARHFGGGTELAETLREQLRGNRGQMAMVRSGETKHVQVGDKFVIFPPMT